MQFSAPHIPDSEPASNDTFDIKDGGAEDSLPSIRSQDDTPSPRLRLVSSHNKAPRPASLRPTHSAAHRFADEVMTAHLPALGNEWLEWSRLQGQSPRTDELRRMLLGRLQWFLDRESLDACGGIELRRFFQHLLDGHKLPNGRWDCGKTNRGLQPLSPVTLKTYYLHFNSFFNYLIEQELLEQSPMAKVPRQRDSADQIEPFTADQVKALLKVAQKSRYPRRNEAMLRLLLDTGMRASELCGLKMGDIDLFEARARVLGKGDKERTVRWGTVAARALRAYLREEYYSAENYGPHDPLFLAEGGPSTGRAMTRSGLRILIAKLGQRSGLKAVRCSPHTFRHTFAIMFLRAGGNLETLQQILGHTSLKTTLIYVKYARADIERQQRQFSPGDRLGQVK